MYNRAYCFYLSQLRTRVEIEFALLIAKWRMFRIDLAGLLKLRLNILQVAMKLHNFIVNINHPDLGYFFEPELEPLVRKGTPSENRGYLLPRSCHVGKVTQ